MSRETPQVYLASFAKGDKLRSSQAHQLSELVADTPWLVEDFPDTVARYSDWKVALGSIKRFIPGKDRYIIRRSMKAPADGVSSIIYNQTVNNPEGSLTADDIDYWLARDGRFDVGYNRAVVRELLKKAVVLKSEAELVMASARPDQPQYEAFSEYMDRFARPSAITIDEENDVDAMTKHGARLQLFTVAKADIEV